MIVFIFFKRDFRNNVINLFVIGGLVSDVMDIINRKYLNDDVVFEGFMYVRIRMLKIEVIILLLRLNIME